MALCFYSHIFNRAAVTFAEGIESQNVVGYQEISLQTGYNIFAPTFDGVNETLDIQDIKLQNSAGDGTDVIWVLDEGGIVTGETYYWLSKDFTGLESDCWSADGATAMSLEITSGQGFYVYTDASDASILVSGQVKIGEYSESLQAGYNLTGNFSPVELSIQNVKLSGVPGDGTDVIWVLDAGGIVTGETYYWLSKDFTGLESDCWSADGATAMEKVLQPGEGLYLYTDSTTATISLPAVISAE